MPRYVAFLRAVNVGGRIVKMDWLRGVFEDLGFANVETFIASGNVIFDAKQAAAVLERKIEERLRAELEYEVPVFIRTTAEVAEIAVRRPFAEADIASAGAFVVGLLKAPLEGPALEAAMALRSEVDDFRAAGAEIYWLCKVKQSESKFTNAVFERKTKLTATWRGISTMEKLARKYGPALLEQKDAGNAVRRGKT